MSGLKETSSTEKEKSSIAVVETDVAAGSFVTESEGPLVVQDKEGRELERAAINAQPITTKWEMIGYAFYYFANNSSGPYAYTPTAFQNIITQAGWDKDLGRGSSCTDSTTTCMLDFGSPRSTDSVVLIQSGIGFALQTVVFLFLGAFSDYGNAGYYVILGLSVMTWGVQFGFLGVHDDSKYKAAFALSILSSLGYQGCQSFWTAIFPTLARNLPKTREAEEKMNNGEITSEEYFELDEYYRNKITNYCWAFSNVGMIIVYAVAIGILFGMDSRASTAANNWGISIAIMWANVFWIVFSIPFFVFSKKRENQKLPQGESYLLIPFKQLHYAFKSFGTLKQTAMYLVSYWLLGDGLNTAINIQGIIQNDVVSYDMIEVSYLYLLSAGTSIIGMFLYWYVQKRFKFSTKVMFMANAFFITLFPLYGLIGTWTSRIGFHHVWEVYFYQAYSGIFIASYYAYSSTMMSCVCPRGKEYLFFAIFSTVNKTSSFIGPFVSSAIIDRTGNTNSGFSFCLALCVLATAVCFFVSEDKSKVECEKFLLDEQKRIQKGEKIIF